MILHSKIRTMPVILILLSVLADYQSADEAYSLF